MDVRMPDGRIIKNVPEGTTKEQIQKKIESSQEFSATQMVRNIPSSAIQYGKDIATAVTNPIDTAAALGNVGIGSAMLAGDFIRESLPEGMQQGIAAFPERQPQTSIPKTPIQGIMQAPGILQSLMGSALKGAPDPRESARQVGSAISDRYGSIEQAKQTLMTDPVGALADVSGVLTGGGSLISRAPGIVGKAGTVAQKAGIAMDPINAAVVAPVKAAGKGILGMFSANTPRNLYMSSAKFPTTLEGRADIADTAIREGILPTEAGVGKFETIKSGLISEIDTLIAQATETGQRIPRAQVNRYLMEARQQVGGPRIRAKRNLAQIDDVAREFNSFMDDMGIDSLSPQDLQTLKKSIYTEGKYDAKTLKSGVGTDAAMKQMGRAAKESIEGVADVGPINKRLGSLLELEDPLKRSAGRIENLNLSGIGAPIKIAAGQAVAGPFGAAAATGLSILDTPKVKARLAIALSRAQEGGKISPFEQSLLRTMAQQGLLQGGRLVE